MLCNVSDALNLTLDELRPYSSASIAVFGVGCLGSLLGCYVLFILVSTRSLRVPRNYLLIFSAFLNTTTCIAEALFYLRIFYNVQNQIADVQPVLSCFLKYLLLLETPLTMSANVFFALAVDKLIAQTFPYFYERKLCTKYHFALIVLPVLGYLFEPIMYVVSLDRGSNSCIPACTTPAFTAIASPSVRLVDTTSYYFTVTATATCHLLLPWSLKKCLGRSVAATANSGFYVLRGGHRRRSVSDHFTSVQKQMWKLTGMLIAAHVVPVLVVCVCSHAMLYTAPSSTLADKLDPYLDGLLMLGTILPLVVLAFHRPVKAFDRLPYCCCSRLQEQRNRLSVAYEVHTIARDILQEFPCLIDEPQRSSAVIGAQSIAISALCDAAL